MNDFIFWWLYFSMGVAMCNNFHRWNINKSDGNKSYYLLQLPLIFIFCPIFYPVIVFTAISCWCSMMLSENSND